MQSISKFNFTGEKAGGGTAALESCLLSITGILPVLGNQNLIYFEESKMTSTTKQVKSNTPKVPKADELPAESAQVTISPEIFYFIAEGVKLHNSKWNA